MMKRYFKFKGIQPRINIEKIKAEIAFLSGSPERAFEIAKKFSSYEKVTEQRGFVTYKGDIEGQNVCVTSTGIECPSAAIVVEEQLDIVRLTAEFTENAVDVSSITN